MPRGPRDTASPSALPGLPDWLDKADGHAPFAPPPGVSPGAILATLPADYAPSVACHSAAIL
jgi:hypothetical protein